MENVFKTHLEIHERYDIKGSLYKRTTDFSAHHTISRKELDLIKRKRKILLFHHQKNKIMKQIVTDSNFLAAQNIIDYSMLIGIHDTSKSDSYFNEEILIVIFFGYMLISYLRGQMLMSLITADMFTSLELLIS